MTHIETMKLALEALEEIESYSNFARITATSLRQAIEQAQQIPPSAYSNTHQQEQAEKQEPVAWITQGGKGWLRWHKSYDDNKDSVPLYTAPPQRQPLTPESVFQIADQHPVEGFDPDIMAFARAIEAAHGIKENT